VTAFGHDEYEIGAIPVRVEQPVGVFAVSVSRPPAIERDCVLRALVVTPGENQQGWS